MGQRPLWASQDRDELPLQEQTGSVNQSSRFYLDPWVGHHVVLSFFTKGEEGAARDPFIYFFFYLHVSSVLMVAEQVHKDTSL